MKLFDQLPTILDNPAAGIPPISQLKLHEFEEWEAKVRCRPVYGWRHCPENEQGIFPSDLISEISGSDSDGSQWDIPASFGARMGMFFPGAFPDYDSDSEMDDGLSDEDEDMDEDEGTDTTTDEDASEDGEGMSEIASLD